jgi:hypothetical protein
MLELIQTTTSTISANTEESFSNAVDQRLVTVVSGTLAEQLPVADRTVSEIRRRLADRLNIDPQSQAFSNGNLMRESTIIRANQTLVFIRRVGEKG